MAQDTEQAKGEDPIEVDPIDEEAAEIDARSPDAPEKIEELKEDAAALGREVLPPGEVPDDVEPG